MSNKNVFDNEVSVDEQAFEKADEAAVDEDGFEVVDETPKFQATVQMEVQAKVDANHPDGMVDTSDERIYGATLEQEERIRAREAELERISAQAELGTQEGREKRTRDIAAKRSAERRAEFQKRAARTSLSSNPGWIGSSTSSTRTTNECRGRPARSSISNSSRTTGRRRTFLTSPSTA